MTIKWILLQLIYSFFTYWVMCKFQFSSENHLTINWRIQHRRRLYYISMNCNHIIFMQYHHLCCNHTKLFQFHVEYSIAILIKRRCYSNNCMHATQSFLIFKFSWKYRGVKWCDVICDCEKDIFQFIKIK